MCRSSVQQQQKNSFLAGSAHLFFSELRHFLNADGALLARLVCVCLPSSGSLLVFQNLMVQHEGAGQEDEESNELKKLLRPLLL